MLAAAAAWDGVAAELETMAAAYSLMLSTLAGGWQGSSFAAMTAAAEPYKKWLDASATTARQTATQARATVAAYELAFGATVPPPVIAANRSLLASLIATNILGQNTPAIAATELDYVSMWLRDAAAMYSYASSASAASALTPFSAAPQTTNSSGILTQAAAVTQASQTPAQTLSLLSAIPQSLHSMAASALPTQAAAAPTSLSEVLRNVTIGSLSPFNLASAPGGGELFGLLMYSIAQTGVNFAKVSSVFTEFMQASATGGAGSASGSTLVRSAAPAQMSASAGRAALVGNMSVPPGWVSAAPEIKPAAVLLPASSPTAAVAAVTDVEKGSLFGGMALSGLAGQAIAGTRDQTAHTRKTLSNDDTAAAESATVNIILITEDE
jgi:PPE-repeat protein